MPTPSRMLLVLSLASACLISPHLQGAEWHLSFDEDAEFDRVGATVVGDVTRTGGKDGRGLLCTGGAHLRVPTPDAFSPTSGSIRVWVQPKWDGTTPERHTLLNMQHERTHLTLFKTEGPTLRFAYRGRDSAWFGLDMPVTTWKKNSWHRITANWRLIGEGRLLLILDIDGTQRFKIGAAPFEHTPTHILIGARGPNLEPANAVIDEALITDAHLLKPPFPTGPKPGLQATVDAAATGVPMHLVHDMVTPWNARGNPLPFQPNSPYHRRFAELEFSLARIVAFSDTWLWGTRVEKDAAGRLQLDFTDFDGILGLADAAGTRTYIRLAYNMPQALRPKTGDKPNRHAYAIPDDLSDWDELMRRIVRHCVARGEHRPRYYVTALNEADMAVEKEHCAWEQICDLYARTTRIVKEIDPGAKVGGPAIAYDPRDRGAPYMRGFLAYCSTQKLPVDFICYHGYRKGHPREFAEMLETVKTMVREEYPGIEREPEYFIDEFNLWDRGPEQDSEYGAAYITASQHFMKRAGITKVGYVSFNHFLPESKPHETVFSTTGPFDKTDTQSGRFRALELTANGVTRPGILAHSPSGGGHTRYTFGRYTLTVPDLPRPRLNVRTGLAIDHFHGMDGVTFEVVLGAQGQEKRLLKLHQRPRDWREHTLDLTPYRGQQITIEWRTYPGPVNATTLADWGAWGEPRLLTGTDTAPSVAYDFAARIAEADTGIRDLGWTFSYNDETIGRYIGLPLLKGPVVTTPFFALEMQGMLGGTELPVDLPDGTGGIAGDEAAGIIASRDNDAFTVFLWTFDLGTTTDRTVAVDLRQMPKGRRYTLIQYLLDQTHSNPYDTYVRRGEDTNGGEYNLETGSPDVVRHETITVPDSGILRLETQLQPMAVSTFRLIPR